MVSVMCKNDEVTLDISTPLLFEDNDKAYLLRNRHVTKSNRTPHSVISLILSSGINKFRLCSFDFSAVEKHHGKCQSKTLKVYPIKNVSVLRYDAMSVVK